MVPVNEQTPNTYLRRIPTQAGFSVGQIIYGEEHPVNRISSMDPRGTESYRRGENPGSDACIPDKTPAAGIMNGFHTGGTVRTEEPDSDHAVNRHTAFCRTQLQHSVLLCITQRDPEENSLKMTHAISGVIIQAE